MRNKCSVYGLILMSGWLRICLLTRGRIHLHSLIHTIIFTSRWFSWNSIILRMNMLRPCPHSKIRKFIFIFCGFITMKSSSTKKSMWRNYCRWIKSPIQKRIKKSLRLLIKWMKGSFIMQKIYSSQLQGLWLSMFVTSRKGWRIKKRWWSG